MTSSNRSVTAVADHTDAAQRKPDCLSLGRQGV
jgi:hypothetical protein